MDINYWKKKKVITDLTDLQGKKVLLRCDFNVPIDKETGKISDHTRINASLQTIKHLLDKQAKVIILSHLSRIKSLDDIKANKKSLKIVSEALKNKLPNTKIVFAANNQSSNLRSEINSMPNSSIMLLENTRYCDVNNQGEVVKWESKNNPLLGKFWASLGDVFINDAFGTCHRLHASNVGIAQNIKESAIGFLVASELTQLTKAVDNPNRPLVAIFGGNKVTDKVKSIENIGNLADRVLIGGRMSYIFLKAKGYEIGKSLEGIEELNTQVEIAKKIMTQLGNKIVLPIDSICATNIDEYKIKNYLVENFPQDLSGFDIGKKSVKLFKNYLKEAKTVIWNGPVGVFEKELFCKGTFKLAKFIAKISVKNGAYSVVGGGDSASAIVKSGYAKYFGHISTGGGASLDFFSGVTLPGILAVNNKGEINVVKQTQPQPVVPKEADKPKPAPQPKKEEPIKKIVTKPKEEAVKREKQVLKVVEDKKDEKTGKIIKGEETSIIIISTKGKYAQNLFDEKLNKSVLFYKVTPLNQVKRVLIYVTTGEKGVVGEFDLQAIDILPINAAWTKYGANSCLTKKEFTTYFKGHKKAHAMIAKQAFEYSKPKKITDYNMKKGPSGFRYLK